MSRITVETRRRVIVLTRLGYSVSSIQRRFNEEGIFVSKKALYKLLQKYRRYGIVKDMSKPDPPRILNEEQMIFIDEKTTN